MPVEVPSAPLSTVPNPASVGSSAPPSSGVINVIPQPVAGMEAPIKPGSAKASMVDRLMAKAKDANGAVEPKPVEPAKPTEPPKAEVKPTEPPKAEAKPTEPTEPKPGEEPIDPKTKEKINPWRLVDEHKARVKALEQQLEETKKKLPDEAATKSREERMAQIEKRAQELEDEIRYVNYSKSQEFVDKYQKPYEQQWSKTMSELSEIVVLDGESERPVAATDILELVNLPLGKAREIANEKFGDFADDVMQHRKEIRALFENQQKALDDAKKSGMTREQQQREQWTAKQQEIQNSVKSVWEKANEAAKSNPEVGKIFQTDEADAEGNAKLESGYKFVDEALAMNPFDPKLTNEQRAKVVEMQAAVRNRAAAFGKLRATIAKIEASRAALEAELAQYKQSVPPNGGSRPAASGSTGRVSAMQAMTQRLQARAK